MLLLAMHYGTSIQCPILYIEPATYAEECAHAIQMLIAYSNNRGIKLETTRCDNGLWGFWAWDFQAWSLLILTEKKIFSLGKSCTAWKETGTRRRKGQKDYANIMEETQDSLL